MQRHGLRMVQKTEQVLALQSLTVISIVLVDMPTRIMEEINLPIGHVLAASQINDLRGNNKLRVRIARIIFLQGLDTQVLEQEGITALGRVMIVAIAL